MKRWLILITLFLASMMSMKGQQQCLLQNDSTEICGCIGKNTQHQIEEEFSKTFLKSVSKTKESRSIETPRIKGIYQHLPYGLMIRFEHRGNADGYVYRIEQNGKKLVFKALRPDQRATDFVSAEELGLTDFDTPLDIEIYASYRERKSRKARTTVQLEKNKQLKKSSYKFQYEFNRSYGIDAATGEKTKAWTQDEIKLVEPKIKTAIAGLKALYQNPASDIPFIITKYVNSSVAYKIPEAFEIRIAPNSSLRLIIHEIAHAWRCPVNPTVDQYWNYQSDNSYIEESWAELDGRRIAGLLNWNHHLYDYYNTTALRSDNFWTAGGGMNEQYIYYGIGATALEKATIVIPHLLPNFYSLLCSELNKQPRPITKEWIKKLLVQASGGIEIEGMSFSDWWDKQHLMDAGIYPGDMIFQAIDYTNLRNETISENRFYLVEMFDNGNVWRYTDKEGKLHRYNKNGTTGVVSISRDGDNIFQENVQITPIINPPLTRKIGKVRITSTTAKKGKSTLEDMEGFKDHYLVHIPDELALYQVNVTLDTTNFETYRIWGQIEDHTDDVLIGLPQWTEPTITINDEEIEVKNQVAVLSNWEGGLIEAGNYQRVVQKSNYTQHVIFDEPSNIVVNDDCNFTDKIELELEVKNGQIKIK